MPNLYDLIKRYSIKHDYKIKNICNPLKDCLGVSNFGYYFIENDGRFGMLGTDNSLLEYYYQEKLYNTNPWLRHPKFFRSGYALTTTCPTEQKPLADTGLTDPNYLEISGRKIQIGQLLIILQQREEGQEVFTFDVTTLKPNNYLRDLELLKKFSLYFKREVKSLIDGMHSEGYNIQEAKGKAFFEKHDSWLLSNSDTKALRFLKKISPFSDREQQCLDLYKEGHSAQETAAKLGLSQRTVEHYFENMKTKLACMSKRDLLNS